jgi:hypothetical protein
MFSWRTPDPFEVLFLHRWWRYNARETPWVSIPYHAFNLFEAAVWFLFAGLVFRRYLSTRASTLEVWYALAFATFGLTYIREAYALDSWLIWLKLVNLVVLLRLRAQVIARIYPGRALF